MVIRGLSRDVRVTLTSVNSLTQGWGVEWLFVDTLTQGWGGVERLSELPDVSLHSQSIFEFHSGHWTLHSTTGLKCNEKPQLFPVH